jgi:hypothetical protein
MRQPKPRPALDPRVLPEEPVPIPLAPRSPVRAALWSFFVPGGGQLYNKQLDKAVLVWIWVAAHAGTGTLLLLAGLLASWIPSPRHGPPFGDWVADHPLLVGFAWAVAGLLLWAWSVRDASESAGKLNRGEVAVRYPLRRQLVHVLASQLLGLLPVVGFLFPPGVVAEALDAAGGRRRPDHQRLLREGGQALIEWAVTRLAISAGGAFVVLWALWWVLRASGAIR